MDPNAGIDAEMNSRNSTFSIDLKAKLSFDKGAPMKKTLRLTVALLLLTFICSEHAHAWSDPGHMAVAFIAYKGLTPAKRARVDELIRLNPRYNLWVQSLPHGISQSTKNGMLFMIAATWADQIKSDGHISDGPDGGNRPPNDGTAAANIGYQDQAMHKYWHFIDLPFSTDGTATAPPETPNALTQIAAFRAVLASTTSSDALKSYDLVWLMHLVGDVHQPLHATARFTHQSPSGDAGGNFVTVCSPHCGSLHSFWDGLLGSQQNPNPNTVINMAQGLPAPPAALAADVNAQDWINESFSLAKSSVYKSPVGPGGGPFTITANYRNKAQAIARQRVALAGARLARILNAELN